LYPSMSRRIAVTIASQRPAAIVMIHCSAGISQAVFYAAQRHLPIRVHAQTNARVHAGAVHRARTVALCLIEHRRSGIAPTVEESTSLDATLGAATQRVLGSERSFS
jgi:hypothetical protein